MDLAGKKALVTGASRGIGLAIAESLLREGAQVFGTSRNPDSVQWPNGVIPVKLDLSSVKALETGWNSSVLGAEHFDIVINNAGSGAFGEFADEDFSVWERQLSLMLTCAMRVSRFSLQNWSKARPGVLVNVTSLAVEYPLPYMSGYNAAKAGLAAFSEALMLEVDPAVAKILELRLGDINTAFNDHVSGRPRSESQNTVWDAMHAHVSAGPTPDLVAKKLVKSLRSDRSGVVKCGSFFQTVLASNFGRLISHSFRLKINRRYYNLGKD